MLTLELSSAYDAPSILFGAEPAPLPAPAPGEVVIRVGAWSLQDLRACDTVVRHNLMWDQDWYDDFLFSRQKLTPGVYRVRLPIPDSNNKNFAKQKDLLGPGEAIAPAALVAVALLCHRLQDRDLLDAWIRCAEVLPDKSRSELGVDSGRVVVGCDWDGRRSDSLFLGGCRKS